MPNGNFVVADVAAITPEIIGQEALGMLTASMQLANLVTRDTSLEKAKAGKVVNIAKRGALVANQKVSGENVTKQSPAMDSVNLTLEHWEVTFSLEDIIKTITVDGMELDMGCITDAIGVLVEKIESKIAALFADAGLTVVGDGTTELTEDMVLEARENLTNLKAPQTGRVIAASARQTTAALKIDRFTTADKIGSGQAIAEGALGKIHSFTFVESPFVPTTVSLEKGSAFHKWGIALATRSLQTYLPKGFAGVQFGYVTKDDITFRVVMSYDPDGLSVQFTIDTLFAVGLMRDELVQRLLTDGS